MSPEATAILGLVDGASLGGLAELEAALRQRLAPTVIDLGAHRWARLGALARLLEEEGEGLLAPEFFPGVPLVPRRRYEELAPPPPALSAQAIVAQFGSWPAACRAVYGLRPDGSTTGPGQAWTIRPGARVGKRGAPFWTERACLEHVRACALDLGRTPRVEDFRRWRHLKVRAHNNAGIRIPDLNTIKHHCGGSWAETLRRLRISDTELLQARTRRLLPQPPAPRTVAQALAAVTTEDLTRLGLTARRRDQLAGTRARRDLPLEAAIELATALHGSLAWLAGAGEHPGSPPRPATRIDADAVVALRGKRGATERELRAALDISTGEWRGLLAGRLTPTLGHLHDLAHALGANHEDLLT